MAGDCTKNAVVGHRLFDDPVVSYPGVPLVGTPAKIPVLGPSILDTWGDVTAPRQWWVVLSGNSRQLDVAGPVTQNTPGGVVARNAVHTRARIDLGNDHIIEHDWRGTILLPPTRSFTLTLLGFRDPQSARLDQGGVLPAQGSDDTVTIENLYATVWQASKHDEHVDERQSRGRQIARVVDVYDISSAQNTALFMPLQPWCQRIRVRAFQLSGGGAVSFRLITHAVAPSPDVVVFDPPAPDEQAPWIDVLGAIGVRFSFVGVIGARVQMEQEVDI